MAGDTLISTGTVALVVHIGLGLVSLVLFLAAFGWQAEGFLDPSSLVSAGATKAALLRWGAAADLLSYYLAIPVIAYVLWRCTRPRSPHVADLSFLAACAYAVAGGIAASLLAVVGPSLMESYAESGADQAVVAVAFGLLTGAVYAVWQFLDPLLLAAWWLGTALLLRVDQVGFARLSGLLAVVAAVGAFANLLGFQAVLTVLLAVLAPAWLTWAVWLLVLLRRRRVPFSFGRPGSPVR
ncbi:hypothetical protein FE374_06795 [Georgenia yuyongxinii]|uniref:DUF4386 family protein n=1 Tax=Georgenia yuyongxinii TaxID=2589797 RepID=A0A5B8C4N2_9MICO|nr:hypothetical protein [Georgenia yuyongxinii]QDC24371.1 hypothetical protein FE374_06795 [Georgenia yuyongxinii]